MISEQGLQLWKTGSWIMFVCDEQNRTLLKLQFDAADLTGALSTEIPTSGVSNVNARWA
jgi:hypothetical protein